ncbi:MAG TPA: hypothetical protein PK788_02600 [Gemmatimonadaceae bacterium]|nr:hypothetical protein [Gemmatimonadaceae bacterium]HRQ78007.1 hypothetical protein [Gemmatimonadaceae bacterium]
MSHLSIDRLAAIADETPTPDEATHLAGCWDCRAEVAAYRRLARMSAMAPTPSEPLSAWSQLAPQLRAAGLIVDAPPATNAGAATLHAMPARKPTLQVWAMRAAAGLALVIGGGAIGRATAPEPAAFDPTLVAASTPAPSYSSPDDAIRALTVAQQQYSAAAAFLASQDSSSRFIGLNRDTYEARLATLDEIAALTRAALYRAPQDPMLNQYYLTTLGAREATLREIGASLPASRRLERY